MTQDTTGTPTVDPAAEPAADPTTDATVQPAAAPEQPPATAADVPVHPAVAPAPPAPVAPPAAAFVPDPGPVVPVAPPASPPPAQPVAAVAEPVLPPSPAEAVAPPVAPPVASKRWPLIAVSILAVLGLAASGVLGFLLVAKGNRDAGRLPSRGQDALVVASRFAGNVTTYDYHHLTDDFARVLADSAGKFKDDYAKTTAASGQFIKLVQTYQGIAKGEVSDVALEALDGNTAIVVMLVTQTVQNSNRPAPQVTRTDGRITLTRINGVWKVTDFKVV